MRSLTGNRCPFSFPIRLETPSGQVARRGHWKEITRKKEGIRSYTRNVPEKPTCGLVVYNRKCWRSVITRQCAFRENIYGIRTSLAGSRAPCPLSLLYLHFASRIARQQRGNHFCFLREDTCTVLDGKLLGLLARKSACR